MTIRERVIEVEEIQLEDVARKMFNDDQSGWLRWETLDESIKREYRRIAAESRRKEA